MLSGFIIVVISLIFFGNSDYGTFLIYYCIVSFMFGSPAFFALGIPMLHFFPKLKNARPRNAGLIGAALAGFTAAALTGLNYLSDPSDTAASMFIFVIPPTLWAGVASCIYQRTKQLTAGVT
ncbi:hypothetical protein [Xanthomonas arboricola]|nr:hypothetical protein [Xanthomonas arboricola]